MFIRFCECLNQFDGRYVIVGSEAVAFHGAPRYSADFDTFVLATRANLSSVDFTTVDKGAVEVRYGTVPVRFIGLNDLLANKRAAGRPKDLADVAALETEGS